MERTITPREMQALEHDFMQEYGVPAALLMEHAAQGITDALETYAPGGKVLFLCGPGNNGGDGYAAARIWQSRGGRSRILELKAVSDGDAGMNRRLAIACGIPVSLFSEETERIPDCDAVCDALFGTGLNREVTGAARLLIEQTNASGKPVVAVDIPSGLDGNNGEPLGCAVKASVTVTFHRIKQGLVLGKSASYTGRIVVHPILIPKEYAIKKGLRCMLPGDLAERIPARDPSAHKGTYGRVVILAGSFGMAGAAALCARAAIRTGTGLTTILARASIVPVLQVLVPGATCVPLPEQDGHLTEEAVTCVQNALRGASAAAIGPGLAQQDDLLPLLDVFRHAVCPVVWDADALNLLAAHDQLLPLPDKDIATPHPGEASRLLDCGTSQITADPLAALERLHQRMGCPVLLKGARTLMTDGSERAVNIIGTPAMAKGGSGDVLTGIMAALLAQGLLPDHLTVMQCAALIHGMAGIRAAGKRDAYSILSEELVDAILLMPAE